VGGLQLLDTDTVREQEADGASGVEAVTE